MVLAFSATQIYAQDGSISADTSATTESVDSEEAKAVVLDFETGEVVELDEVAKAAVDLFKDYKGMGKLGLAIALLNLFIMFLKTNMMNGWFQKRKPATQRLLLVVFGQALGILLAMEGGLSPWSAVLGGLLTSGGAVAIYEVAKPFFKKQ